MMFKLRDYWYDRLVLLRLIRDQNYDNDDEDHDFKTFDDDCDESLNANTLMTAELRAFEPLVWF